jgi:hypothetical protein
LTFRKVIVPSWRQTRSKCVFEIRFELESKVSVRRHLCEVTGKHKKKPRNSY